MSFGVNLSQGKNYTISNNGSTGNYSFNGQTTLLGMGDFFLGYLSGLTQSAPIDLFVRQKYVGLYGQDTWKATSRLTVNYGVRWEPYLPQVFTNGRVYNFDITRFEQGIKSTVFPNAPAGLYYPGDPGFPGNSGINKQWAKFGPRVGLALDPRGDGRTSIRASYSMNYDYIPLQWRIDSTNASPWTGGTTLISPPGGLENPWQGIPGGNPFPVRLDQPRFAAYGNFVTSSYDLKPTVVHSWNLSVQRQVASDVLVTASYLGSHQVHVWVDKPLNNAVYIPGGACTIAGAPYNPCSSTSNTNARRRFSLERPQDGQFIGFVDQFDDGGTQGYHGLLVSVQRRAARGLTINGNYTLSHCIGDNADTAGMGPNAGSGASMQDPNNRRAARGNCPGDRRQIFNLTAVAETPRFANPTLRAVATGWRLSPIYRLSSGQYLTVTSGIDRALNGISTNGRPNQVLPNPYGDRSLTNYLNPAAFVQADPGTLGNMGRSNILGPKSWQFDVALSRTFDIRERQKLELRAEAYNITNSLRMGNPATVLNTTNTFGQITTSGDPRIMQFALKYVF
jgi:hypothetical protein